MEQIDDLQNGYFIIQKDHGFKFGIDAVLLADFADMKHKDILLDMCTGTGIVPILIYAKRQPKKIIAIEIQEEMVEMANRSVTLNQLESQIEIKTMDLKEAPKELGRAVFDVVTCNPPYMKVKAGINNPDRKKALARFEIECTLEDVIDSAKAVLKSGGKLIMVHRADRLVDLLVTMRAKGVEPKRIRFIHPNVNKPPNLLLIEAVRGGKPDLKIMDPLYVYDMEGNYTQEIEDIYERRT